MDKRRERVKLVLDSFGIAREPLTSMLLCDQTVEAAQDWIKKAALEVADVRAADEEEGAVYREAVGMFCALAVGHMLADAASKIYGLEVCKIIHAYQPIGERPPVRALCEALTDEVLNRGAGHG